MKAANACLAICFLLGATLAGCMAEDRPLVLPSLSLREGDRLFYAAKDGTFSMEIVIGGEGHAADGFGVRHPAIAIGYTFDGNVPEGYKNGTIEFIDVRTGVLLSRIDGCSNVQDCQEAPHLDIVFPKRPSGAILAATAVAGLPAPEGIVTWNPGLGLSAVVLDVSKEDGLIRVERRGEASSDSLGCDVLTNIAWINPTSGLVERCVVGTTVIELRERHTGFGSAATIIGRTGVESMSSPSAVRAMLVDSTDIMPPGAQAIGPTSFPLSDAIDALRQDTDFMAMSKDEGAAIDDVFVAGGGIVCTVTLCEERVEWNVGILAPSGLERSWRVERAFPPLGAPQTEITGGVEKDGRPHDGPPTPTVIALDAVDDLLDALGVRNYLPNSTIHTAVQGRESWTIMFVPPASDNCRLGRDCEPSTWVDLHTGRVLSVRVSQTNYGDWFERAHGDASGRYP